MTIEFRTIGFPEHLLQIESGSLNFEKRQTSSESMLSRGVLAAGMNDHFWSLKVETALMERDLWQEWNSIVDRIDGRVVLFTIPVIAQDLPLGYGAGFTEDNDQYPISGTTITGTSILTGGTTAQVAEAAPRYARAIKIDFGPAGAGQTVLRHGDVFGLGGNLYRCVANVIGGDDGVARVPFRWRLWKGAQIGDIVNFRKPTFRAQLRDANDGSVNLTPPLFGQASFNAIEVPYI